jgi:hypothetical protein
MHFPWPRTYHRMRDDRAACLLCKSRFYGWVKETAATQQLCGVCCYRIKRQDYQDMGRTRYFDQDVNRTR